ncbi:MAG: GNAT family N-acetyltransferase [Atopobiaceae bacterium]|nr:GNAT family N-acetyltransferase [Atopobiaceae bacterium]
MHYRTATPADIPEMSRLRQLQLIDEGVEPTCNIEAELERWFTHAFNSESFVQWLAEDESHIVATAAIVFYDFPPVWDNPSGRKGYITNMYTSPEYRGQGIASSMLERLAQEAQAQNVSKL